MSRRPQGAHRADQALRLYTLVSSSLGESYQHADLFRIGSSSLAEQLEKEDAAADLARIKGLHSRAIRGMLGYEYGAEVVHRNNLVVL